MNLKLYVFAAAVCVISTEASAQIDLVTTPPPNLVLSNYNSAAIGPFGGLEGTAYVARVADPSAAWFNPAGLTRESSPQVSGSAGVYQKTLVAPSALPNDGGSIQQLPNFVGFTVVPREGFTLGASLLTTNSWNQETDSEVFLTVPGGQQRFAYSADSEFSQRVLAFSAGYHRDGPWRVGGGLAFSMMSLRLVQTAGDRIADASGLRSLLVSARASGSALQLRTQGGVQYDMGRWRFGGAVRSPGLTIHRSGTMTFDGVLDTNPTSFGASLFDPDADLEYHLPWEFQAGGAYVTDRLELEFDLQMYTSIGAYPLLSTEQPVLIYGDAGGNTPPTVLTRPFAGLTSASDGVVNFGAGGHYRLRSNGDLRLHAGLGSNRSPVQPADRVFTNVDLFTWSLGVSGSWKRVRFAAGINHQSGDAEDVALRNLIDGTVVQSSIDVSVTGFIYSIAYQF